MAKTPFGIGINDFANYEPFYYQELSGNFSTTYNYVVDKTGAGYVSTVYGQCTDTSAVFGVEVDGVTTYRFNTFDTGVNYAGIITPWSVGIGIDANDDFTIKVERIDDAVSLDQNITIAGYPNTDGDKFLLLPQPIFFKSRLRVFWVDTTGASQFTRCRVDGAVRA